MGSEKRNGPGIVYPDRYVISAQLRWLSSVTIVTRLLRMIVGGVMTYPVAVLVHGYLGRAKRRPSLLVAHTAQQRRLNNRSGNEYERR